MEDSGSGGGQKPNKSLSRKELLLHLQRNKYLCLGQSQCVEHLCDYVASKLNENEQYVIKTTLQTNMKNFVTNLMTKYRQCNRFVSKLLVKEKKWIEQEFIIPMTITRNEILPIETQQKGRPKKLFQCSSTKTKTRAVSSLVTTEDSTKLMFATQKSLQLSGKRSAAKVVEIAASASPKRLKRMKKAGLSEKHQCYEYKCYTPNEALALMVDCEMTKDDYIKMQQGAKHRGCNLYPSYKMIQKAKLECYPDSNTILISENGVELSLQSLLDFTLDRLSVIQGDVFSRIKEDEVDQLKVLCKWGFDGSGGHSIYKQNFSDSSILYGDSNIILCSVVPLEIITETLESKSIFWKATSASSTRFCRPLIFRILHETKENVKDLYNTVVSQIENLQPKEIEIEGKHLIFSYVLLPTMFDGKIINTLTDTKSTQSCYICKAKAKDMNNIKNVIKRQADTSTFKFGLSVLHAYIRTMELLLNISYKLTIQNWQARGDLNKKIVAERKTIISERFYREMGLVVDRPKQGGGNSNDGNTARRFFADPEKVAVITELDEDLIRKLSIVLSTLASGFAINTEKFKALCLDTAEKYTSLYNWYNMSVTVHKVLIHGPDIINSLILPIGTLTEDIQETRQKDFKNFRLLHTRKTSRVNTNTDIFNMMLITTDPVIVSLRQKPKKKSKPFIKDVVELFEKPEINTKAFCDSEDVDESEDELDDDDDDDDDDEQ